MEKTIKLNGEDLKLKSSLFTIIEYRNVFGTELFNDIKKMDQATGKDEDASLVIDTLFKVIYILHRPYTKKSYDEFLMELDFTILQDVKELENISNIIGELLGGPGASDNPK